MTFPSESELAAIRRTQAELAKPANRSAIDSYARNGDQIAKLLKQYDVPSPTARMNAILKSLEVKSFGIVDPKVMAGLNFGNHGIAALAAGHSSALQRILDAQPRTKGITSAFDSLKLSFPQASQAALAASSLSSMRAGTVYDAGMSDSLARAMPNLTAAMAALPKVAPPIGILEGARTAVGNFDLAILGLQAQMSVRDDLIAKVSALNLGLPTANLLSAQIERAANTLGRVGLDRWSQLPTASITGLAALSSLPPLAGASALDLMSVARGVYGVTSFASRAAEMSVGNDLVSEPDETVEDWASGSLSLDLRAALADLHPALAAKLEGAWDVYRRRGPDALGQAATSLVELIDRSMDLLAPTAELTEFAAENNYSGDRYFTNKGNPTVALKVRFVLRARPLTAEAVEAQVTALTRARKKLQVSKHSLDFSDDLLIGRLLLTVENVFTIILLD